MRWTRRTFLTAVAVIGGAMLLGPSPLAAAEGKVLRFAFQADINTFDPDNGFEVAGLGAINAVYEGLVEYAPETTKVVGLLAESWTISPDKLVYTFKIRDGVVFHDGTPMTSAEVVAALKRRQMKDLILSYFLWNVKDMQAPDPHTVVLTLGEPQPSLLDNLASAWGPKITSPTIMRDHAGEDLGRSYLAEHADGTGPYKLASFERGQQYVLERNEAYWGEKPYFDRIEISIVPDIGQQILQLQAGQLDMIQHGYPIDQLTQLPPGFKATAYDDLGLEVGRLNRTRALADPEVLKAVKTAINPDLWVKDAFGEFGSTALSLYPRAMLKPEKPIQYPSDMEAARAIIKAKGPVSIELGYSTQEAGFQQRVADLIIAQLQSIGVNATARVLKQEDIYTFKDRLQDAPDIWLVQLSPDAAHPETSATLFYTTGAPLNVFGYSNPEADKLVKQAGTLEDVKERDRLYEQASQQIFDDGGFFPLADVADVIVHREGLTNFQTRSAIPWTVDLASIREAQ